MLITDILIFKLDFINLKFVYNVFLIKKYIYLNKIIKIHKFYQFISLKRFKNKYKIFK